MIFRWLIASINYPARRKAELFEHQELAKTSSIGDTEQAVKLIHEHISKIKEALLIGVN
ncbi:MAG: hypothetical protein R2865_05930 [Deinococcales bacterium]